MEPRRDPRGSYRTKHPELPYGVYWRDKGSPYVVKFWDPKMKRTVHVGCFCILKEATEAAEEYLRNHK